MLGSSGYAKLIFNISTPRLHLFLQGVDGVNRKLFLANRCRDLDWKVLYITQMCHQFSFLLSTIEQLDILGFISPLKEVDMDNTQWLEIFQLFIALHTLHISHSLQSFIMPAFQELTVEMATEVLPALHSIYLEEYEPSGPEHQAVQPFITARQHSGHPVAIHCLERPLKRW
jgi:hypothetical protein